MCGIIDFFLLREWFQCLVVSKLNNLYSFQYFDKFLSINQINFFFSKRKKQFCNRPFRNYVRRKIFRSGYIASLNPKKKFVIINVLIVLENDGAKQ